MAVDIQQHDSSLMEQDRLVSFTSEYRKEQLMFTETTLTVQGQSRDDTGMFNSEAFCFNLLKCFIDAVLFV